MKIVVIDGQGGNIGKRVVEEIKANGIQSEVMAIGTNSTATAQMMKGGADIGATGGIGIGIGIGMGCPGIGARGCPGTGGIGAGGIG